MWITKSSARRRTGLAAAAVVVAGGAVAGGVAVAQAASPSAAGTTVTPTSTASATTGAPAAGDTGTTTGKDKGKDEGRTKGKGKALHAGAIAHLKGVQHATWVTEGKDGTFVTHDAIHGAVTTISPTSVTVKAKDGVSQTYTVTKDTRITLGQGHGTKPKAGATTDVATGADVVVSGTGSGTALTAERVAVPKG